MQCDTFDERRSCRECWHGAREACPDGAPLEFALQHNCPTFCARDADQPRLRPNQIAPAPFVRMARERWSLLLAATHENDRLRGGPAMRCPDGVGRHPDGSLPGEPPANQPTT